MCILQTPLASLRTSLGPRFKIQKRVQKGEHTGRSIHGGEYIQGEHTRRSTHGGEYTRGRVHTGRAHKEKYTQRKAHTKECTHGRGTNGKSIRGGEHTVRTIESTHGVYTSWSIYGRKHDSRNRYRYLCRQLARLWADVNILSHRRIYGEYRHN